MAAKLTLKANSTETDALSEQVADLSLSLEGKATGADVVALTGMVAQHSVALAGKADGSTMMQLLGLKADASQIDSITTTLAAALNVSDGEAVTIAMVIGALTPLFDDKADAAALESTLALLPSKVNRSAFDKLVARLGGQSLSEIMPCRCAPCALSLIHI